jgi:GxxExxY protein
MNQQEVTQDIISAIIQVHQTLGPGFLESIYRNALVLELQHRGLRVKTEKRVKIFYEGEEIGEHRLDVLVNGSIIVELKTVEALSKAHYAQLRSYLKATGLQVGILVNFASERADYRRVERP